MLRPDNALHDNETCRRLIAAAAKEFAQRGFAGARIRTIVDAAEVNLASINYYFGGKAGLYEATLGSLVKQSLRDLALDTPEFNALDPERRLLAMIRAILGRFIGMRTPTPVGRILAHEAMNPTPALDELVNAMARPQLERLRATVREIVGPSVDEESVTLASLTIVGQCLIWLFGRSAIDRVFPAVASKPDIRDRLVRHIWAFSMAGLDALHDSVGKPRRRAGDSRLRGAAAEEAARSGKSAR
jgi:TetR/AcrR family transcriptional regulator, regulator of cefoperazone and chloramphenicol sensitivity